MISPNTPALDPVWRAILSVFAGLGTSFAPDVSERRLFALQVAPGGTTAMSDNAAPPVFITMFETA